MQTVDWKDVAVNLLECFGANEGTWFRSQWKYYDIPEEAAKELEEAWHEKYSGGGA